MSENETSQNMPDLVKTLQKIRFTMFGTRSEGEMRVRPMTTLDTDDEGRLWFFCPRDGRVAADVRAESRVSLIYADAGSATFVNVYGHATPSNDQAKVDELWNPLLKPWFEGPDDPNLQLLDVQVESAEYWEGPDTRVGRIVSMARAAITGDDNSVGEHGTIENKTASARG